MSRKSVEQKIYAKELGIDLASLREKEYFKWFLACLLFAKPIQQVVAKRAYFEFVRAGLVTPEAIIQAGWDKLVEVLERGRYRYSLSTATKLLNVSKTLQEKYGTLTNLLQQSQTIDEISSRLQEFNGIGPKTTEPFLCDITPIIDGDIRTSIKASNGENAGVFCPSCGAEHSSSAHFCRQCGYPLDATVRLDRRTNPAPSSPDVAPLDGSKADSQISIRSRNVLSKLPVAMQRVIAKVLVRARDAQPEESSASAQEGTESRSVSWGWLPILALTSALGLLSVAYTCTSARYGATGIDLFFWLGLLLIFVPSAVRLISPEASRFERVSLLCVVGISFYLIKVLRSPLSFYSVDEFLHWRTVDDIARSGHLFSINSVLPVSPFYPGLEIVTNALSSLSGLNTFYSGIIVVGVARLLMILSLFMLYELVTKSARTAGIAVIVYMADPHFLLSDAIFAYGSLALPLATFMLFIMVRNETLNSKRSSWATLAAAIALGAAIVTHHTTTFFFDVLLILWAFTYAFLQRPVSLHRWDLAKLALFGSVTSVAWILLPGNTVTSYLFSYLKDGLQELGPVLVGGGNGRHLFVDYAGGQTPLWERAMAFSSVALISLCIPFGLLCLWQRYRSNTIAYAFGIASLFYPLSHLFRLTSGGSEISDRVSAYLFLPVACVLAIFITQFWPTRRLNWKRIPLITCAISVAFLGGAVLGQGPPSQLLPGPYLVIAGPRSFEPEGIQAATWARLSLGPNNRIATDNMNRVLMNSYGDQVLVTGLGDNIDVSPVFFSSSIDPYEVEILRRTQVHYLVVDLRLSTGLPIYGFYFEPGEPGSYQHTTPISRKTLTKFNTIPQVNRVFDSGNIVFYDVGGLINASEKP